MAKRLTDTTKWDREWFQNLSPTYKSFWSYLCDKCDHAGIWQKNIRLAEFVVGDEIDEEKAVFLFGDRIQEIGSDKWYLPGFVLFQYGEFCKDKRVHMGVISVLKKNGLQWPIPLAIDCQSIANPLPRHCHKDKDKDKDKDLDKAKDKAKDKATAKAKAMRGLVGAA